MKIVINEEQYNRLFIKPKTKLIITESQYKVLVVESELKKSFNEISDYDKILITKENDDEMRFKVTDTLADHVVMVNLDNAVYKNFKFYITTSDLQNKTLTFSSTKDLEADIKDKDKWNRSTFNNIKRFSVFTPDDNPKFDVDVTSGAPKKVIPPEDLGGSKLDRYIEGELNSLAGMDEGENYVFKLKDGNELTFNLSQKHGKNYALVLLDGDKILSTSEELTFEFTNDPKNIKVKTKTIKDKNNEDKIVVDYFDLQLTRNDEKGEDESGKMKSSKVIIKGVESFESTKTRSDREEKEAEEESADFDWDALEDMARNDQNLKDIIQKNPAAILDLTRMSRKLGSIPAEDIMRKWGVSVRRGEVDYPGSKFISNKKLIVKFEGNGNLIDYANRNLLKTFEDAIKEHNGKVGVKVDNMRKGDTKLNLSGKVNGQVYRLEFVKEKEGEEDTYIFKLKVPEKGASKQIKLATFKIKVINYDI